MEQQTPRSTPREAQQAEEQAIDGLNARWNLAIPRRGEINQEEHHATTKDARRCFGAIAALSWRANDLNETIARFELAADDTLPGWRWKDHQVPGTLPAQPANQSQLQLKRANARKTIDPEGRKTLLRLLMEFLKSTKVRVDNREAAERAMLANAEVSAPTSKGRPQTPPKAIGILPDPAPTSNGVQRAKRKLVDPTEIGLTSDVKKKGAGKITDYIITPKRRASASVSREVPVTNAQATSFETTVSTQATSIFTQDNRSAESFLTAPSIDEDKVMSQDVMSTQFANELLQDPAVLRSFQELDEVSIGNTVRQSDTTMTSSLQTDEHINVLTDTNGERTSTISGFLRMLEENNDPFANVPYSTVDEWRQAQKRVLKEDSSTSITQSGSLTWASPNGIGPRLYDFNLHDMKIERSCRFHRRFGSDRFMLVYLPLLAGASLPKGLKRNAADLGCAVASWFARSKHVFLGRKWSVFFLEPEKTKSRAKTKQPPRIKVFLFAESGQGIDNKMPVRKYLDWHFPISQNMGSTDCKAFQRFSLGLSKTIPTVILDPMEFAHKRSAEPIMDDGCARMSETLAREISAKLNLVTVPSVFQGRVAGAKGIWMVDKDSNCDIKGSRGFYLEVADDSQLKIKPHPADPPNADEAQRTFEVLEYSRRPRPAFLNFQILTILHHNGVKRETLREILVQDLSGVYEDLAASVHDPLLLRAWIATTQSSMRTRDFDTLGSWPTEQVEQAILLLESGFDFLTCPLLIARVRSILRTYMSSYIDRFQIKVPLSTTVYCIADPYGVLAEDEVHCCFSSRWEDESRQFNDFALDNMEVLVARSPAFLPSDIQKRKARYKHELRHFQDVVVFPITGSVPLASLLSGGDYDGDTVWLTWDQRLTEQFRNAKPPKSPPSPSECGISSEATKLSAIFKSTKRVRKSEARTFFQNCFMFNMQPSFLGHCALEFDKVAYHDNSISSPQAIKLASMAGYLVDAAKAGSAMSQVEWDKVRKEVSPRARDIPAYRDPKAGRGQAKEKNILDWLKFWIALPSVDDTMTKFHQRWGGIENKSKKDQDQDLIELWEDTETRKKDEIKRDRSHELKHITDQLFKDMETAQSLWHNINSRELRGMDDGSETFLQRIRPLYDSFQAIQPEKVNHPIYTRYIEEHRESQNTGFYSHWSLLRASCLYTCYPRGSFAWFMAGGELCELKRRASGRPQRSMLQDFYSLTKFDGKTLKKQLKKLNDLEQAERFPPPLLRQGQQTGMMVDEEGDDEGYDWEDAMSQVLIDLP